MRIILHPDGSIEYPEGVPEGIRFSSFFQDPNNPNRFIPKFDPCIDRVNQCTLSPCGKRAIFQWHCNTFDKMVTSRNCEGCNARRKE